MKISRTITNITQILARSHSDLQNLVAADDHTQYIRHALATAVNDVLMASGVGVFVKQTLAQLKTALAIAADIAAHAGLTATHGVPVVAGASSGSYAGDNAVNRAIPHGLGHAPAAVFIWELTATMWYRILMNQAFLFTYFLSTGAGSYWAVSASNATNFYVGNAADASQSANMGASTYHWVAVG